MVIHDLTTAECRDVLARTHLGRLACARANQPYIVPFFFYFSAGENCLYSFATRGQKIDWMRTNPRVCVELDDIKDQTHWTTVVIFGRYEELDDSAPATPERHHAFQLFQQQSSWWVPATAKRAQDEDRHTPIVYRIEIDSMSGRRAARS